MTNSTRCALLAKQACTTLSHVVQKITPPSANNFLKLFFALFAMLALGVGTAWAEELEVIETLNLSVKTTINETPITVGDVLSITGTKGTNNFPVFNYNQTKGVDLRFYQGTTCSVTFTAKEGYKLEQIVFKKNSSTASTLSNISVNSGTLNSNVWTASESTESVTFTYNNSSNLTEQIYKIYVTYSSTSSGGTEPPTPTTQYTIKWHTDKGVTTDVTLNEGATITKPATDPAMTGYEFMGWTASCDVASDGADFTALTDFGTADSDKDFYAVFAVATTTGGGESTPTEVTDVLNRETTGVTGTSYTDWTEKTASSSAIYAGQSAGGNESIQLRSKNSNSGIITTASGGKVQKVVVEWNSETSNGNKLDIYGKNSAYSNATDLYNTTNQGTKLGSIVYGTSTELMIEGDYDYIGMRSSSGAIYMNTISITWSSSSSSAGTTTYSDYITTCASGIEYVELGDAFKWNATEAEVTIDATDNVFPTLTNTHNVPVKYSSSDDTFASIAADGIVTLKKEGTVTITAKYEGGTSAGTDKEYKAKTVEYTLTVKPAPLEPIAGGVIDILDNDWSGLTTFDYATVAAKTAANTGHSNAQYTAQCAGSNSSIQLRSNNSNSGIVSTVSGGLVKRVEIEWNDATSAERTLNIYGSNTPYTNPTDLYGDAKGELLGELNKGEGETTLDFSEWTGDYKYIGFRSKSGAMYLTTVTITWLPTISKVTIDDQIEHGSVSVSGASDLNSVAAGTVLTLSNTPATGYKLTAYDVYKTGEATTKVTVTDGKFIMPEFDVTISATFELAKTLTGINITTPATQTTFWQGETFNYEGLKVTAHFDGADDEDVTDKVTVTGSTATAGAAVEVTVSYNEGTTTKTATYNITVKDIPNTKETAYTVADAFDIIDKLGDTDKMYITGFVSQADLEQSSIEQYKNADYWISADGTTNGQQLEAFRGKYLDNTDFTSVNQIMVGDEVIIYGKLTKYGSTYEFAAGNYLVSLKRDKQQPGLAYAETEHNANVGEDFAEPALTNPNNLTVTYSSSNTTLATVNATTGEVTILAAGKVTITATTAGDATYAAGSASYNITITDPSLAVATLPFTFNSGKADIENTAGMSQTGLDDDYNSAPKLRFNSKDDNVIVHFDSQAGEFSFLLKQNGSNAGTFTVYESANGEDYTSVWSGGNIGNTKSETITPTLAESSRYVKFEYTTKGEGTNYALGSISIAKPDTREEASLAWDPSSVTLTQGDAFTAPTLQNPKSVAGITYDSSNDEVATVTTEGVIALASAIGTATITATFAGDAIYKPATATCTITVNEYIETIDGEWQLVTDASKLQIGMEIIIASVADGGAVKTMGEQGNNNRRAVASTVDGDKLNPAVGTTVITLEDCQLYEGLFALKTEDGYLYAASYSSNHLRSQEGINDNACWTITITEGVASVVATNSSNHNVMRYNKNSDLFSCYEENNNQQDIAIYAKVPDCTREIPVGYYGTVCLPSNIIKVLGATLYEVAGKEDNGRVVFDEVLAPEAGMPYIFLSHNAEVLFYCGTETATEAGKHNSLQGTFNQIDPAVDNILVGNYMVVNNVIKKCGINCGLQANRAYFTTEIESLGTAPALMPGRRRVTMGVTGENEATGVDNITENGVIAPKKLIENGQLIIIRDGVKYNVQGQKL